MRFAEAVGTAASVPASRASHCLIRGSATLYLEDQGGRPGSVARPPFQSLGSKSVISAQTAGWSASDRAYSGSAGSSFIPFSAMIRLQGKAARRLVASWDATAGVVVS